MNDEELLRYSRQLLLPKFGVERQKQLIAANVLIIGLGGIGCPVAMYLAAAGVGQLVLADYDVIDLPNLQRQIAYHNSDIGLPKTQVLKQTLENINPNVCISLINEKCTLDADTFHQIIPMVDVVIDTTDNFSTRFATNALCLQYKKPLVSGSAIEMQGQISVFDTRLSSNPCYQCLFPNMSEASVQGCSDLGILSPLVGIVGSMLSLEAIKLITKLGNVLLGKLMIVNAVTMEISYKNYVQDPNCPACVRTRKKSS